LESAGPAGTLTLTVEVTEHWCQLAEAPACPPSSEGPGSVTGQPAGSLDPSARRLGLGRHNTCIMKSPSP
jgi:hypothetical protein